MDRHVFLSYCKENNNEASRLSDDLKKFGLTIWRDVDKLETGSLWRDEIDQAIQHSFAFVLCLSKELESRNKSEVYREIYRAIDEYAKRAYGAFIFPVRLSECNYLDIPLNQNASLRGLQTLDLFPSQDWEKQVTRLAQHILSSRHAPANLKKTLPRRLISPEPITFLSQDRLATSVAGIFHPGQPTTNREFLVGRNERLKQVIDLLQIGGHCPAIIGMPGIGKTSLGKVAISGLGPAVETSCNVQTTFREWASSMLLQAEISRDPRSSLGPDDLYRTLREHGKLVIVIDEFDRIKFKREKVVFNDFIKIIMNHSSQHELRIVVMGVAKSIKDLFHDHAGIYRHLIPMELEPVTQESVLEFLEKASSNLNIKFAPDVLDRLKIRGVFPDFLHLVGYHCATQAIHHPDKTVTKEVYEYAAKHAIDLRLGLDSKWDFARNKMSYDEAEVLQVLLNNRKFRCDVKSIKMQLKESIEPPENILNALAKRSIVSIQGDNKEITDRHIIEITDRHMIPFLSESIELGRYVTKAPKSSKQKTFFFTDNEYS